MYIELFKFIIFIIFNIPLGCDLNCEFPSLRRQTKKKLFMYFFFFFLIMANVLNKINKMTKTRIQS